MTDSFSDAMTNRSLRAVRTELEFLFDANVISQEQFDAVSNQLPRNAAAARNSNSAIASPMATPVVEALVPQMANMHVAQQHVAQQHHQPHQPEERQMGGYYAQEKSVNAPPPAYSQPPVAPAGPPALSYASALYQYNAQDAGDLALMPNDKITVTEYMNNEWWKGRNERTGQEGIFPASYVRQEEKAPQAMSYPPPPSNYGNMPLDVSNSAQPSGEPTKTEQNTKKIGKKLGNAAIFGAGATIGGKIVNSIF